jgi:two-component system nitrogen regulation sensor histidine kinase GlnL
MTDLTFSTDPGLCIRSWGKEIANLTGRSAESVVGSRYHEVLPPFLLDGKDALGEAVRLRKPLLLKDYRINCLYSGLTADVRIAPHMSPANDVQELSVTLEPTANCAVFAKLSQSQQLIRIGRVASSLAHGVRNPLNAIKGAVVYLNEKYASDPSLTEFTKIMEEEISRLEMFISRFLSSSVPEGEGAATDVNALLNRISVLTTLQLKTRNIVPAYDLGDVPLISTPSFHVEQSVLNVVNNAIDAMGDGGQLLVRTYTAHREQAAFAVIEISDTGPGIADVTRHTVAPGSSDTGRGFGLFITCEILKHYHGHLDIDSKKGRGTTVRMSFPSSRSQAGTP